MKKKLLLCCVIALSILCSACQTGGSPNQDSASKKAPTLSQEEDQKETSSEGKDTSTKAPSATEEQSPPSPESTQAESTQAGITESETPETAFQIKALENLGAKTSLLTGRYTKGGDIRTAISFYPTSEGLESNRLECIFLTKDIYGSGWNSVASAILETESGKTEYTVTPEFSRDDQESVRCEISFFLNDPLPRITVSNDPRLEGDYYPFQDSFTRPDLFTRYLSRADLYLYPTEDLWLLRNEIYAAHGRKFDSEVLNQYFSARPWYRPLLEPDEFSDSLLSDLEKKNISLIRELEEEPFDIRNTIDGIDYASEWDRLPAAPYLSHLKAGREIGLSADLTKVEDMGVYYAAPGSISVPASITQEQFAAVQKGGEAEVILNELTGESRMLSLDPAADTNTPYGYLLYEQGQKPSAHGSETGVTADLENGTYTLWQTSADTVMKTVYEGDIYLLKGAVTGAYTSLSEASKNQREIRAGAAEGEGGADSMETERVGGNELYYNSKGYFTAVYSLGD